MNKKLKLLILSLATCLASGCVINVNAYDPNNFEFGVFLGASQDEATIKRISNYKEIVVEISEFSNETIKSWKDNNIKIAAYLNVGAIENYRDYYTKFSESSFKDYENWDDERWMDVSNKDYQDQLYDLASSFKNMGADSLFLDNYDVYYISLEELDGVVLDVTKDEFKEKIYQGLIDITTRLSTLGMNLIVNSGLDFLERAYEDDLTTFNYINAVAQETVFSRIMSYKLNMLTTQKKQERLYFQGELEKMSSYGLNVYLIEYTRSFPTMNKIKNYCEEKGFKYYYSSTIDLK